MIYRGTGAGTVAAQVGDPSALLGLSAPVQATLSFLSILVVSVGLLSWRAGTVDEAVDRAIQGLPLAAIYGVIPFGVVLFVSGYVLSQTARVGVASQTLAQVLGMAVVAAIAVLAALGYLVVGAYATELEGERRLWVGAAVGAGLTALPWLVLPTLPALATWVVLAAIGLGGTTQTWVHGERTVETEARDRV